MSNSQSNNPQSVNDPTKLLETVNTTEVFGLVPLLYCLLLDPNSRPIDAAGSMTNDTHNSLPPSSSSTKQSNKTSEYVSVWAW
ncbi:unnamed protein product [Trichobilharzia regenti]|nr:unnamed protein product [Trichobilharzia regenti]